VPKLMVFVQFVKFAKSFQNSHEFHEFSQTKIYGLFEAQCRQMVSPLNAAREWLIKIISMSSGSLN